MRVMVFMKSSVGDAEREEPATEAFAAMDRFTEELVEAGIFVAAAGLKNNGDAKRIVFEGAERTVIEGPFAENGDLVLGFAIWEVKDIDEAVAWARRAPNTMPGRSEMEIRPFYEVEDLAEFLTPEELANPRTGERGRLGVA